MTAEIVRPLTGRIEIYQLGRYPDPTTSDKDMSLDGAGKRIGPEWHPHRDGSRGYGHWSIAREYLISMERTIPDRDGEVILEMHYSTREIRDTCCQQARGTGCVCSCEGKRHGGNQQYAWIQSR